MLRRTRLSPVSKNPRKAKERALYAKLAAEFKRQRPVCEVCCATPTKDVHHSMGRGRYLNDVGTWVPVCRKCHDWIHSNPSKAREWGLLR